MVANTMSSSHICLKGIVCIGRIFSFFSVYTSMDIQYKNIGCPEIEFALALNL